MGLAEYSGALYDTRTVYFNGAYALRPGQPLFYLNSSATGIKVPDFTTAAGALQTKTSRIGEVVDGYSGGVGVGTTTVVTTSLATGALLTQFAGIVSDAYVGFIGPGFVDIIQPKKGDVMLIEVDNVVAISINTSLLVVNGTGGSNATAYEPKATPIVADSSVFLMMGTSVAGITQVINPNTPGTNDLRTTVWALCVR